MNKNENRFDWIKGFTVDFDLATGLSANAESSKRRLSGMRGMYFDGKAEEDLIKNGDPLVYEFYEMGAPNREGDLAFGTSITYPGKVGNEYFMTKGHFHNVLKTAETYYCLSEEGYMMLENPEGDWSAPKLKPGTALYVPPRYAHRSINTGKTPLITFFCFRADAGHDYGTIETKGFRKLLVEEGGTPAIADNPKWK
ncbi:MAG: glucose-6-phosphate isomerase [Burkholderiales bacterium]